ncbi:MAG TPA: DUF1735 domain-containing protein [Niastella sp.]|nr:DUF1735 domain-containing protein [Niastella sp.]
MKSNIIIKTLKLTGFILPVLFLASCLKDKNEMADLSGSTTPSIVEIHEGGLGNFANSAIILTSMEPDSLVFHVNLASEQTFDHDVTVTLDYDEAALNAYNASSDLKYEKFPDSIFSFPTKQITIPAGQRAVEVPFVVLADKVDLKKSYMFPISVTDAGGNVKSGNFGTIYYHLIGNPLAGPYTWDFTRYNNADGSGTPNALSFSGESAILAPLTPTQLEVASGYFIQPRYEITFDDIDGVQSNFQVTLNEEDVETMSANGVTVIDGPNIIQADPVNKVFEFQYVVVATGGVNRYIIDKYYK